MADTRTFVFNSAFYLTTNGTAANLALPGMVRQTGNEIAGKVILQDCSLNNDAGDPQNTFTNLVGSFTYNGTRYIKPPNADGSYTNANFVLWGTNVDGSITNINGGGVSVGTGSLGITNGGAIIHLNKTPGMLRVMNNGVSTIIDSNTITTGNSTNTHVQTSTLRTTSTAHIGGDLTVVGGNVILPNSFQGIIGTRYASYTNGLPANPFAGWSYSTNGASAVTLGLFASVPTTGTTITYVTHSNSSSAAVAFTGPAGTIGPDGSKPAVFYTPAASEVVYGFFHNAQRSTNMFVLFRTNMIEEVSSKVAVGSPVSLTTSTAANITSISLPAGVWDVSGNVNYKLGAATATQALSSINTTSATQLADGTEVYSAVIFGVGISITDTTSMPRKRLVLTSTTTVYLVGQCAFTAGAVDAYGSLSAVRVQ